ncbi:MAG TPA: helix-turn-helix domain-containing protein [Chloroflexota bacterium]|nr:helix-turn-helix domain-containing protein [Chloroflexota bacterium]
MSVPCGKATFGSLLRAHRLVSGLTQEVLADRAGLSPRTIQEVEAGSVQPRRATAMNLAMALELSGADRDELLSAASPRPRRRLARTSDEPDRHDGPDARPRRASPAEPAVREPTLMALPRPTPTNIPWPVSSLLGREAVLGAICHLIAEDRRRLVTLTGVGGSGKTRLAIQIAADLLDRFVDGAWFVELAPTSDPSLVPRVVAGALGVREAQEAPILETLLGYLRRKRLLLVLDNCEHLIDACAELAAHLLAACPDLVVLATSREPLRIAGERQWQVQPLALPDLRALSSLDALAGAASVQLFVERATAIDATFALSDSNAAAVARVCTRLDGIPLAIELAGSRIRVLTVDQIAARLDDSFRVLTGGMRGGPGRQQTMQAALDWSYELLTDSERVTFNILGTFAGGFDLDAAEAVCAGMASSVHPDSLLTPHYSVLDVLSRLVDKSLVVAERGTAGHRYRLLEPVRQFAAQALLTGGGHGPARAQHASYYLGLAERASPLLSGPEQVAWLGRLEAERDNLRAALTWIAEHGRADDGLRLAVALGPYWEARGSLSEGRHWLQTVLAASRAGGAAPALQLRALLAAGTLARLQRDLPPANALLSEGLEAARSLADRRSEAEALGGLASVHRHLDAVERALMLSEASVRLGRELDDEPTLAAALLHQGMALGAQVLVSGSQYDLDRAVSVLEESLMCFRHLEDVRHIAIAATVLGRTLRLTGDHARAAALLREAVLTLGAVGDQANMVDALGGLAHAAMALGESRQAAHLLAASRALRNALGMRYSARNTAYDLSIHEALLRQMTASELDEAYAAGEAMNLDQVVADIVAAQ